VSTTKLRLIETTDLHMQLSGYDYLRDKPTHDRGLARLAMTCDDGTNTILRIGIIGLVTPQISDWNKHLLVDRIITDDIVHAAKTHIAAMRREGADIVVGLCHAGLGAMVHTQGMENAAAPLAALLGIDVVLAGHTHNFFPGDMFTPSPVIDTENWLVYGKPMVMAGYDGLALGVIDLELVQRNKRWDVTANKTKMIFAKDIPHDPHHPQTKAILDSLEAPHQATRKTMNAIVAHTKDPLSSHFTMIGIDPTIDLIAQAYKSHLRGFLADELAR